MVEWESRTHQWLKTQQVVDRPEPSFGPESDRRGYGWESSWQRTPNISTGKSGVIGDSNSIQVIVKLSALYLTPESPICSTEDEWALDGVPNEHICATAIYVFDDNNVTDTRISFRSRFDGLELEQECLFDPDDTRPIEEVFGFTHRSQRSR
ncbi:hypothetical protein CGRA01v4_14942 [Colletotrichum graminicola]|nr:hypothetical protein CGRA01v4_14942 [Colletotrichum graminicola]